MDDFIACLLNWFMVLAYLMCLFLIGMLFGQFGWQLAKVVSLILAVVFIPALVCYVVKQPLRGK